MLGYLPPDEEKPGPKAGYFRMPASCPGPDCVLRRLHAARRPASSRPCPLPAAGPESLPRSVLEVDTPKRPLCGRTSLLVTTAFSPDAWLRHVPPQDRPVVPQPPIGQPAAMAVTLRRFFFLCQSPVSC